MGAGTGDMADSALHNFTSVDAAAILENVTDGLALFEANGDIALWNGAMFAINGFPRLLFTGFRNISQAFHWQFENGHLERSHPTVEEDVAAFMTRFSFRRTLCDDPPASEWPLGACDLADIAGRTASACASRRHRAQAAGARTGRGARCHRARTCHHADDPRQHDGWRGAARRGWRIPDGEQGVQGTERDSGRPIRGDAQSARHLSLAGHSRACADVRRDTRRARGAQHAALRRGGWLPIDLAATVRCVGWKAAISRCRTGGD